VYVPGIQPPNRFPIGLRVFSTCRKYSSARALNPDFETVCLICFMTLSILSGSRRVRGRTPRLLDGDPVCVPGLFPGLLVMWVYGVMIALVVMQDGVVM
jgi:hypothetical protein